MSNIHIYNLVYVYSSMSHTFIRLSNPFPPSDGPDVPKLECRHPKCPHFRQRHQLFVCWGWWSWHCWDNLILVISMFITSSSSSSQTHPLFERQNSTRITAEESGLKITKQNSANGGIPETFQEFPPANESGKILPLDSFFQTKKIG